MSRIEFCTLAPDASKLVVSMDQNWYLFHLDARSGKRLTQIEQIERLAWSAAGQLTAFSNDGTRFAACMPDTSALIWDLADLGL